MNKNRKPNRPTKSLAALGMTLALSACGADAPDQPSDQALVQVRDGLTVESHVTPEGIWTVLTDAEQRVLAELEYSARTQSAVLHDETNQVAIPIDLDQAGTVTLAKANDIMLQAWSRRASDADPTQRGIYCWWESNPGSVNGACGCEWPLGGCDSAPPSMCCWWC